MKAGEVRRAKVILRLAAGQSYRTIMKQEGCGQDFVARWKERFGRERLAGLYARHRGKIVSENIIRQEAKILNATKQPPPDGSTHWSTRKLARYLGASHSRVARVWARAGIQLDSGATWPVLTRSLKSRQLTSLDFTSSHRLTRRSSASTRRALSKRWTGWIRFCHSPLAGPNDTASSITATARSRCMRRSIPPAAR